MHSEPDPSLEKFDVVDSKGDKTGEVKSRSQVHYDGDWHRSFHLWVVTNANDSSPHIVFQRRSAQKDTNPGRLDVAVGGHYRSGEGFAEVVREIEEELGIAPPMEHLVPIGRRWSEDVRPAWVDREIQDVFVYCLDHAVSLFRPSFEEITALEVIAFADVEKLFVERQDFVIAQRYEVEAGNRLADPTATELRADDFIPVPDRYWLAGSRAAVHVFNGERDVRLELG